MKREETIEMPTDFGNFDCHLYRVQTDGSHHLAFTRGEISPDEPTIVRVHSECLTGDVFGSRRCDCGGRSRGSRGEQEGAMSARQQRLAVSLDR